MTITNKENYIKSLDSELEWEINDLRKVQERLAKLRGKLNELKKVI